MTVPVTILTGFLGSGKTTLLNRILTEEHGKRIAVIENEFGEVGIDQGLVVTADEEIFEMSNGCICCTVRGDLIRVLGNLARRRDRFDYVLVETTGLADPGPVAQTFFMDDEIAEQYSLDGIVTVIDAVHVDQQLGRSRECEEQIAFADVIVVNKTDLVDDARIDELERRMRSMNRLATVHRTHHADVAVEDLLHLRAFDLDQALAKRPTFLEPEYPFEWTGVFDLAPGTYRLCLAAGPDPTMSVVVHAIGDTNAETMVDGAERCVRHYAGPAMALAPGDVIAHDTHTRLTLTADGLKLFTLEIPRRGLYALTTQHLPEEFDTALVSADDPIHPLEPVASRVWVAEHSHDDSVTSVALEAPGEVDGALLQAWIGELLRERGTDIFRMKGFLAIAGQPERTVLQGVHMLLDSSTDGPWGDRERHNQLVFIGRDLDEDAMRAGFAACLR